MRIEYSVARQQGQFLSGRAKMRQLHLILGGFANKTLSCVSERNPRWCDAVALVVWNDLNTARLVHRDAAIRCACGRHDAVHKC